MENQALRYNSNKNRLDLVPTSAIEGIGEVLTYGANKYTVRDENNKILIDGANNWRKGLTWSSVLSSMKRHIAAFERGEDIDPESNCYHIDHALTNLAFIKEYYKIRPEFDDRLHVYRLNKRVGLDVDGVLADFNLAMDKLCGGAIGDPHDWNNPILGKKFAEVKEDPNFWLGLEPMVKPQDIPFEATCYITSRSIDTKVTKEWLDKHGFADAPVYSIGSGESKVETAKKANIDYFIDDYSKNFIELNNAGICTFLMDRSYNQRINAGYKRIKDFNDFKQRFLC